MNLQNLSLFIAVVRAGSFAEAARRQNIDPSSVSRNIAVLEDKLGLRLFQRSTRKLVLTEAGEAYFARIEPLLDELEQAEEEAQSLSNNPQGVLRMTASVAFGQLQIIPLLEKFRLQYPAIELELTLTDDNIDLLAGQFDLACRLTPSFDSQLIGRKLFDTHYRVCASPRYMATHPKIVTPKDLQGHKCLVFTLPQYRSRWLFKHSNKPLQEIPVNSDIAISSALALRQCTLDGLGPSLLADWMVDTDIEQGRLVRLLAEYEVSATDFSTAAWLLYPSRQYLPHKTKAMIEFLVDYIGK